MSVSEWEKAKVGGICIKIGSGATPTGGANSYKASGISLIRSQNVLDYQFSFDGLAFIDDEQADKLKGVTVEDGDILLNITGDSVARSCIVPKEVLPARVNQHVSIVRVDKSKAFNKYVFYYIQNMKPLLLSLAGNGGTRNALTKAMIEQLDISLPSLPEQKAIAATLSALDDMIELNNKVNKTLEEMAQAIFKSWFVDFEPFKDGEFEESELGLIPKGWRVGVLEDIAFINTETINPQNYPETFFEHFSIPLFDEGKFSAFEKGEVIKSNKYVIDSSCMLFSKLNPQFKRVFRPFCKTSKAICSTEFMVYKAKKPIYNNYIYSTLCSGSFHQFVMQNVTGTTNSRQRAIPKNTLNFKMLIPDENALSSYNQIISGIFNIMQRIPEDNKLLSSIRDTILPKLMSGEIRVPVEEVV